MNKKEIAQQFTRQMLGQENNNQQEPDNQSELTQIRKLLPEIEECTAGQWKTTGLDWKSKSKVPAEDWK